MINSVEIPKVIHYCWFGGNPLPALAEKCISSWKKYFPGYDIRRWDESNYDVDKIPYTREAYKAKKYAFVSDYARFDILHEYGGIYFDTDVEVIRPMDDIIAAGPFMGCENAYNPEVNPGLGLGVNPGQGPYAEILEMYKNLKFDPEHLTTVVTYVTAYLCTRGLKNIPGIQEIDGIKIYPKDYFCPIDYKTGQMEITGNTCSIHHFAESWHGSREKLYKTVKNLVGESCAQFISRIWKSMKR